MKSANSDYSTGTNVVYKIDLTALPERIKGFRAKLLLAPVCCI